MEIVESELKLITSIGDFEKNIEVKIDKNNLELGIDKKHLFKTLEHRKVIVGLINKKLDELVEKHISKKAEEQERLIEDL